MDNHEFVQEFLVESSENLDQLDRDLVALEETPNDPERLASIFRTVHTIKGTSGFFGFSKLGALAHSGEHLLGRLRDGTLILNEEIAGTLLSMVDAVRAILRNIEESGEEGRADFRELADAIAALSEGREPALPPTTRPRPAGQPAADPPLSSTADALRMTRHHFEPVAAAPGSSVDPGSPIKIERLEDSSQEKPQATAEKPPTSSRTPTAAAESSVRVDVGLLGSILDLVGELVLARNQLRLAAADVPQVQDAVRRVNAVTSSLQETAMKTRMQPIAQVFSRFPRVVRDLSVSCGKEVHLKLDGADTELDRTLIESIRDPLTHLVRNAVDHGIEPPADRIRVGKERSGELSLRAYHESGQVTVEVCDDGRGISVESIRRKAVSQGLLDAQAAERLSDEEVLQYIFEPGFSTAATVTDVSGRGVGMDVVKTNIEAIGGTVDIRSASGIGTTVRVRIPLTLAIIPALIVRCGPQRLAIPQASVCELVPLARGLQNGRSHEANDRRGAVIEGLDTAPVIRLRGRLLPVVSLARLLGLETIESLPMHLQRDGGTVVRVQVDDHEFGLIVDDMQSAAGTAEATGLTTIVVKPAGSLVAPIGLYAGATVMGDGGVTLILDLRGIARAADIPERLQSDCPVEPHTASHCEAHEHVSIDGEGPLVICRSRHGRRVAFSAHHVSRLERFTGQAVEQTTDRSVVRHAGGFLPLVDLDDFLSGSTQPIRENHFQTVVLNTATGPVGIVVDEIVDVATPDAAPVTLEHEDIIQTLPGQPKWGRRMVDVAGKAAELLDLAVRGTGPPLPLSTSATPQKTKVFEAL
jgi:two-component system chemotaxis sensor kinase CheA